jgi:hypothetical protein
VLAAVVATNIMMMMAVAPSTTSATPPFTLNPSLSWQGKLAHLRPSTHSDYDIEASAEAFVADKVSQACEIHHKR